MRTGAADPTARSKGFWGLGGRRWEAGRAAPLISNFPSPGLAFGKRKEAEDGDGGREEGFSVAQQKGNNERRQKQVSRLTSPFLQPVDTSVGGGGSWRRCRWRWEGGGQQLQVARNRIKVNKCKQALTER